MDMHPSGFSGFVGPEGGGSGFNHFDLSSRFRILPNTSSNDVNHSAQESLSLRSHLQPPHLRAFPPSPSPSSSSPSSPPSSSSPASSAITSSPLTLQPLRLSDEISHGSNNKNGSPRISSPSTSQLHPFNVTSSPRYMTASKSMASSSCGTSPTPSSSSVRIADQELEVFLEEI